MLSAKRTHILIFFFVALLLGRLVVADDQVRHLPLDQLTEDLGLQESSSYIGRIYRAPGYIQTIFDTENLTLEISLYRGDHSHSRRLNTLNFDLSDSDQVAEGIRLLSHYGFIQEEDIDQLIEMCSYLSGLPEISPSLLDETGDIFDLIFEEYLSASLPDRLRQNSSFEFEMDLLLFDERLPLVIDFSRNGAIDNLSWGDPRKAQELGLEIERVYNASTNSYEFRIIHPESEMPFYVITQDSENNLEVLVHGRRVNEGIARDGYEKNTYEITLSPSSSLSVGQRQRFDGERVDPYQFTPEAGGRERLRGIVFGFYSSERQQREVYESILEEANNAIFGSEDYADLFDPEEMEEQVHLIVERVQGRTRNFSTDLGMIESVARDESFSHLGQLVLERTLSRLLGDISEGEAVAMINATMWPFRRCLSESVGVRSTDGLNRCMETFEREAPVDLGREILDFQLRQNNLEEFQDFYSRQYDACIQENYDRSSQASIDIVQACIYESITLTTDHAVPSEINRVIESMDINFSLTPQQSNHVLSQGRHCLVENGLIVSDTQTPIRVDFNNARELPADEFENKLQSCVNTYTASAGEVISRELLRLELSEILSDSNDESIESIVDESIELGYLPCQAMQNEALGRGQNDRSFDPILCEPILRSVATSLATRDLIQQEINPEVWMADELSDLYAEEVHQCFERNIESQFRSLEELYSQEGLSQEEFQEHWANRTEDEASSEVECLRLAIAWASKPVAENLLNEALEDLVAGLEGFELEQSSIESLASDIQICFQQELEKLDQLDDLLEAQDELANHCAIEMLRSENAREQLFYPIFQASLADIDFSDEERSRYRDLLYENLLEKMSGHDDLDILLEELSNFQQDAFSLVLNQAIEDQLKSALGDDEEFMSELLSIIHSDFLEGEDGYNQAISQALENGDDVSSLIEQLTYDVTIFTAQSLLEKEGRDLVEEGLLDASHLDDFVTFGRRFLINCLTNPRGMSGAERSEYCQDRIKEEMIEWVVRQTLESELASPTFSGLSPSDVDLFIDEIISDELRQEIHLLTQIDDPNESQIQMNLFVRRVEDRAIQVVAPTLLKQTLRDNLALDPEDTDHPIMNSVEQELQDCFERASLDDGMMNYECVNNVRALATIEVFNHSLMQMVSLLDNDRGDVERMVEDQTNQLERCFSNIDRFLDMDTFERDGDSCLRQQIISFSNLFLEYLVGEFNNNGYHINPIFLEEKWEICQNVLEDESVGVHELPNLLKQCLIENVASTLASDLAVGLSDNMRSRFGWTDAEGRVFLSLARGINNIISENPDALNALLLESDDGGPDLNRQTYRVRSGDTGHHIASRLGVSFRELEQLNPNVNWYRLQIDQELNIPASSSQAGSREESLWETLSGIEDQLGPLFTTLIRFDSNRVQADINLLIRDFEALIEESSELNTDDLIDTLLSSRFMDGLIQSLIAQEVRDQASESLSSFIENPHTRSLIIARISSPDMIQSLFDTSDPAVRAMFDNLKNDFIRDVLTGDADINNIPNRLLRPIQTRLATDLRPDGFAETIFEQIVQPELHAKRDSGRARLGRAFGVVRSEDFEWRVLRTRPGSLDVLNVFSTHALTPMMQGRDVGDERMEQIERAIEQRLENLVRGRY